MRLPYAPSTPPEDSPTSVQETYTRIAARRHPRPLIPLDLTLLLSPPVADGYNAFVGALRTQTIVPQSILEMAISRVAILTDAVYEWNVHAALALKAGLGGDVLTVVADGSRSASRAICEAGGKQHLEGGVLSDKDAAVLAYTDEVTVRVKVEDSTFERLRSHFDDREVLELTTVIAGYNAVSRILVSLDVGENNGKRMKSVEELVGEVKG